MGVVNCRLRKINKNEDLEEKNEKRKKKLHKKRGKRPLKWGKSPQNEEKVFRTGEKGLKINLFVL